jgi:methylglutaconyl-CoA hydratase
MSEFQQIIYEQSGLHARLTLNRPEKRNALNAQVIRELKEGLRRADRESAVRVIVIRGAGRDFSAGADLAQLEQNSQASVLENRADAADFAELLTLIRQLSKPVIAGVVGRALAGGAGLAVACDLVIAARTAQFAFPEVRIGFVPAIVLAVARRNLGEKRAFELLTTGKVISAEEAERIGLINRVCDQDSFEDALSSLISEIAQGSASGISLTKSLLYQIDGMTFEQAARAGVELNVIARMTPDCQEGVRRFLDKSS